MPAAFDIVPINTHFGSPALFLRGSLPLVSTSIASIADRFAVTPVGAPVLRAVDEDADEDDDASEPEIVVPPAEPLETASDFDEDDFDDDFDDDFEEEFDDDEFDSEVTPEDLEASDDSEDPFEDD